MSDTALAKAAAQALLEAKIPERSSIVVGVSGGVDSMVLLDVLRTLAAKQQWRITVAHFNHQLRGRSSDADERFVVQAAGRMQLPIILGRGSVRDHAAKQGVSIEMAARELRHRFLASAARRTRTRLIALAHHAGDQAELFLLRLLRGTAPEGLAGMPVMGPSPASPTLQIVRPFLHVERAQIEKFAANHHVRFREDTSNRSENILRNRIRRELLPLLRSYHPTASGNILRLMEIARSESELLEEFVAAWKTNRAPAFAQLHLALQRRLVVEGLVQIGVTPEFLLIENLRKNPGAPMNGPDGASLVLDPETGTVRVRKRTARRFRRSRLRVSLGGPERTVEFGGVRIQWDSLRGGGLGARTTGVEWFDAETIGGHVLMRHWAPGDRFQPIGMAQPVKLQDFLTNLKIPRAQRRSLVLAEDSTGRIFWVEGCRISESHKVSQSTQMRLKWCWQRGRLGLRGIR